MTRAAGVLASLFLSPALLAAQTGPTVTVPRIDAEEIVLDGALDEPVWEQAARLTDFHQYQPVDGRPAQERTEVRVFYTPTAILFAVLAYDSEPQAIRATVADRDNIDSDDNVTIHLDTFADRRRSFFFAVNPLGVQQDGVRTEGANSPGQLFGGETDKNPDYVFESKGHIGPEGYVVELRIPFKSLRYPGGDGVQRWGVNVVRTTQRTGYVDTWADVRRASASFLAQEGTIEGLRELRRGVLVEAQPFVTASADGARTAGAFEREPVDPSAGLNLKLGLTPDLSIDVTVASMASIDTGWRWVGMLLPSRPKVSLAETPSMVILLKRGFWPPAEIEPDARSVTARRGSRRM